MAQWLAGEYPEEAAALGLDAEVVEAACLAHDLGHPPFGHAGEKELDRLVRKAGNPDGFEGNAQSFRVLTKLSVRFLHIDGLDLTAATLRAANKYPWVFDPSDALRRKKWGCYSTEVPHLLFAQGREEDVEPRKSFEAEVMDWADDIAYSVHDLEDFHRCGAIPWAHIFSNNGQETLVQAALDDWLDAPVNARDRINQAYHRISVFVNELMKDSLLTNIGSSADHRRRLRFMTSQLTDRYFKDMEPAMDRWESGERCVIFGDKGVDEIRVLKQITRSYIIADPALAAQQHGERRLIRQVFEALLEDCKSDGPGDMLPAGLHHLYEIAQKEEYSNDCQRNVRLVCDAICSMTEAQLVSLHGRLYGYSIGSVLDPIVR